MANAIPVHSQVKTKPAEPEVFVLDPSPDEKKHAEQKASLLEKAQGIVEAERPAQILDEQVNQIGQGTAYGRFQKVHEIEYALVDRKGEPTGKTRTHIRVDH